MVRLSKRDRPRSSDALKSTYRTYLATHPPNKRPSALPNSPALLILILISGGSEGPEQQAVVGGGGDRRDQRAAISGRVQGLRLLQAHVPAGAAQERRQHLQQGDGGQGEGRVARRGMQVQYACVCAGLATLMPAMPPCHTPPYVSTDLFAHE